MRPELRTIVNEAHQRFEEKDYAGMVPLLEKARGMFMLSGFEKDVIAHLQGLQCRGVGDVECFRKNFIKVIESGTIYRSQLVDLMPAVAFSYLEAKDPVSALPWLQRYKAEDGFRIEVVALIPLVTYQAYGPATPDPDLAARIAADEAAGTTPSQEQLRLLAASQAKASDGAGFVGTVEKMARLYPSKEHWSDLIWTIRARRGFAYKADIDIYRLLRATHALEPIDYTWLARLTGKSGSPGEAKAVKDEGVANGQIAIAEKKNPDYGERWRSSIDYDAKSDYAKLPTTDEMVGRSPTGDGLISSGMAYVTYGDTAKGLAMIEQGLAKGNLEKPEWAKLHYGYAQYWAGNIQKARTAF